MTQTSKEDSPMNLQAETHKGLLFITSFRVKIGVRQRGQNPGSAPEG